jgi:hypothetical protein
VVLEFRLFPLYIGGTFNSPFHHGPDTHDEYPGVTSDLHGFDLAPPDKAVQSRQADAEILGRFLTAEKIWECIQGSPPSEKWEYPLRGSERWGRRIFAGGKVKVGIRATDR